MPPSVGDEGVVAGGTTTSGSSLRHLNELLDRFVEQHRLLSRGSATSATPATASVDYARVRAALRSYGNACGWSDPVVVAAPRCSARQALAELRDAGVATAGQRIRLLGDFAADVLSAATGVVGEGSGVGSLATGTAGNVGSSVIRGADGKSGVTPRLGPSGSSPLLPPASGGGASSSAPGTATAGAFTNRPAPCAKSYHSLLQRQTEDDVVQMHRVGPTVAARVFDSRSERKDGEEGPPTGFKWVDVTGGRSHQARLSALRSLQRELGTALPLAAILESGGVRDSLGVAWANRCAPHERVAVVRAACAPDYSLPPEGSAQLESLEKESRGLHTMLLDSLLSRQSTAPRSGSSTPQGAGKHLADWWSADNTLFTEPWVIYVNTKERVCVTLRRQDNEFLARMRDAWLPVRGVPTPTTTTAPPTLSLHDCDFPAFCFVVALAALQTFDKQMSLADRFFDEAETLLTPALSSKQDVVKSAAKLHQASWNAESLQRGGKRRWQEAAGRLMRYFYRLWIAQRRTPMGVSVSVVRVLSVLFRQQSLFCRSVAGIEQQCLDSLARLFETDGVSPSACNSVTNPQAQQPHPTTPSSLTPSPDAQALLRECRSMCTSLSERGSHMKHQSSELTNLAIALSGGYYDDYVHILAILQATFAPLAYFTTTMGVNFVSLDWFWRLENGYFVMWGILLSFMGGLICWFSRRGL